jgi:type II restriction enzyme
MVCNGCQQNYQIKTCKKKNFRPKIIGAEYKTTLHNLSKKIDYIILLYDPVTYFIELFYVKNENITPECIIPRNPLSITARRAGWQGCYILLSDIHKIDFENIYKGNCI